MQAQIRDIVRILEKHYPPHLAEKWDNVGLQIGSLSNPARKVLVSLDLDKEVLKYAVEQKVDLIVTHHPLFFNPLKSIDFASPTGELIKDVIQNNITIYSAHTNLDSAAHGLNQYLAEKIGLLDIKPLGSNIIEPLYKLAVYVPRQDEAKVREALGNAGAGYLGQYSHCSFRSAGIGTFLPQAGSNPYIGCPGVLEEVDELRLETIVPKGILSAVVDHMKAAHPYEEPAYDIYPLYNKGQVFSPGRTGKLAETQSLRDFGSFLKTCLGLGNLRLVGNWDAAIQKVAVVSGAGTSFIPQVLAAGCDLLVTGDLKYHEAKEAEARGLAVIDAGHQGTEQVMADLVGSLLRVSCGQAGFDLEVIPLMMEECIKIL